MQIFSSNRLDLLAARLSKSVSTSARSIFDQDLVLVQSKAMAKWLKLQIATYNGLSAQIEFPFLREFISKTLNQAGFDFHDDFWSRETLIWRIYRFLPDIEKSFDVIDNYVKEDSTRRLQLSIQLASLYDEYMIYRPDWLLSWERDDEVSLSQKEQHQKWQMALWNKLNSEASSSFHKAILNFLNSTQLDLSGLKLPPEMAIFGITNMPKLFLQFFEKLTYLKHDFQLSLYHFSPCSEYWADLKPDTKYFYRPAQDELPDFSDKFKQQKPYHLLKLLGVLGRDFLNNLIESTSYDAEEFFIENTKSSQLSVLQNGILMLEERYSSKSKQDGSIEVNACHNPMRELEVLSDFIKKTIREDNSIRPNDFMVLCPDITKYSPYIKAVFEEVPDASNKYSSYIPYSISDQTLKSSSVVVASFLKILKLSNSRLSNLELMELLQVQEIRRKFKLESEDLDLIHQWLHAVEIRWGKDASFREKLIGLKNYEQNTWMFGLKRLMNGYAFDQEVMFQDSLSFPVGSDGIIFGKFKSFVDRIFEVADVLDVAKPPEQWSEMLLSCVDSFIIDDPETALDRNLILHAINKLKKCWHFSQLDCDLQIDMVVHALSLLLEEVSSSQGFLDHGVTFCTLLPMRSIPAKVVCLLGMNEGEFPRQDRRSGFDLMQSEWRQGDRSVRLDDRYIFLESLLSAQQKFYLSYCGFNASDNSALQPSVLVTELVEFLNEGMNGFKVTHHPMHAYSERYYNGELLSFSHRNFINAEAHFGPKAAKTLLCPSDLPIEGKDEFDSTIDIHDLVSFYRHPARYFLKQRLSTSLHAKEIETLNEEENFDEPRGLDLYKLKQQLHREFNHHRDKDILLLKSKLKQKYWASGQFSYGLKGEREIEHLLDSMHDYCDTLWSKEAGLQEEFIELNLDFPELGVKVVGQVDRVFGMNYMPFKYSQQGVKQQFYCMIPFLALFLQSKAKGMNAFFTNKAMQLEVNREDEIQSDFVCLLKHYLKGLERPLPFSPNCFEKFREKIKGKNPQEEMKLARAAAKKQWTEVPYGSFLPAECEDEANLLCFGSDFPGEHDLFHELFWNQLQDLSEVYGHYRWVSLK